MTTGVLITDNGVHSAEKWAEATASHIVDISMHVAGEKRAAAVKLEAAIIDILEKHHSLVQDGERASLHNDSVPDDHTSVSDVVTEIISAASATVWAADFATDAMRTHLTVLLNSHFATSMDIERQVK